MELYEEYPDELTHYGVLGMKWGKRKARISKAKAGKAIERNGGKKAAISEVERKAKMQRRIKKGALVSAAILGTVGAASVASLGGFSYGENEVTKAIAKTFANDPERYSVSQETVKSITENEIPAREALSKFFSTVAGSGVAGSAAAAGGAAAAGAYKTDKLSKKKKEQINNIKKYK